MKNVLLFFFICLPFYAHSSLNGIYIFCERTPEYFIKDKEVENENYVFIFFKQKHYDQKKIIKHIFDDKVDFSLDLYNTGIYNVNNDNVNLIDNLIFREKRLKSELNRNTMILKSNYKDKLLFEYFCEASDLIKIKHKSFEIIKKSKKFWKNKFKDNKI